MAGILLLANEDHDALASRSGCSASYGDARSPLYWHSLIELYIRDARSWAQSVVALRLNVTASRDILTRCHPAVQARLCEQLQALTEDLDTLAGCMGVLRSAVEDLLHDLSAIPDPSPSPLDPSTPTPLGMEESCR